VTAGSSGQSPREAAPQTGAVTVAGRSGKVVDTSPCLLSDSS
jgi:hypothetical protein